MKKALTSLITLLGFLLSYGQVADSTTSIAVDSSYQVFTDFKHIVYYAVSDSTSEYYYPKLEKKAKYNKAELTVEECYYFYYGQLFKPGFRGWPFQATKERMDFDRAIAKGNKKNIITLGIPLLEKDPVDLTVLLHTCVSLEEKRDERFGEYDTMLRKLLDAIFSDGIGESPETAIKVIHYDDEFIIKGILGFLGGEESLYADKNIPNKIFNVWSANGRKIYFEELTNPASGKDRLEIQ